MQSPVGVRGREGRQRWCSSLSYKDTVAVSKQGGRVSNCSQGIHTLVPRLGYEARIYTWGRAWETWNTTSCTLEYNGKVGSKTCHPNLISSSPSTLDCWVILSLARKILRICPKNPNRSLRSASWASSERLVTRTVVWSSEEERTEVLGTIVYCDVL